MQNKFTEAIDARLQSIAIEKSNLLLHIQDLDYSASELQKEKTEFENQFFAYHGDSCFIQKLSETRFVKKRSDFSVVSEIAALFLKGEYLWQYSVVGSKVFYELKATNHNNVKEIVSLFNLVDMEVLKSLSLFKLMRDAALAGENVTPKDYENLINTIKNEPIKQPNLPQM